MVELMVDVAHGWMISVTSFRQKEIVYKSQSNIDETIASDQSIVNWFLSWLKTLATQFFYF